MKTTFCNARSRKFTNVSTHIFGLFVWCSMTKEKSRAKVVANSLQVLEIWSFEDVKSKQYPAFANDKNKRRSELPLSSSRDKKSKVKNPEKICSNFQPRSISSLVDVPCTQHSLVMTRKDWTSLLCRVFHNPNDCEWVNVHVGSLQQTIWCE